jgi:hypothetical protein
MPCLCDLDEIVIIALLILGIGLHSAVILYKSLVHEEYFVSALTYLALRDVAILNALRDPAPTLFECF